MAKTKYLVLQNGTVFTGKSFGADLSATGELVFNTSMVGYLETLTDPNYFGQVVVQTFPLIGNYGIMPADFESDKCHLNAYIVRHWCQEPSNFRSEGDLDTFLKQQNVPGLHDIDTRALTRILRDQGTMNGAIVDSIDDLEGIVAGLQNKTIKNAIPEVSNPMVTTDEAERDCYKVVLWDFGAKKSLKNALLAQGCTVITVPYNTTAEQVLSHKPNGIVLSDGPGDPQDCSEIVAQIKQVCNGNTPIMGVGLGHQLLALSQGASTGCLKYGHRGASQPVRDTKTDRVYITSQNHGYVVSALPANGIARFVNVNDNTCEGIDYTNMPMFSVQFAIECATGSLRSLLFERFVDLMKEGN